MSLCICVVLSWDELQVRQNLLDSNYEIYMVCLLVTAKKSDYSSTRGVNGCFDAKSSSMLLFTAVESQLMEKQDCFHFSHTVMWKNQLGVVVTTDTIVWLLNIQTDRGRRLIYYNVTYQKPTF